MRVRTDAGELPHNKIIICKFAVLPGGTFFSTHMSSIIIAIASEPVVWERPAHRRHCTMYAMYTLYTVHTSFATTHC